MQNLALSALVGNYFWGRLAMKSLPDIIDSSIDIVVND